MNYNQRLAEQMRKRLRKAPSNKKYKEPLWWGRGGANGLAVWPYKDGVYHEMFIGHGKSGDHGMVMRLMNDELQSVIDFLQQICDGNDVENL